MTPQYVIRELLKSEIKHPKNLALLKKIILTAYLGRLQINGLPPDYSISLSSYLFDSENIMFDFTRLSASKKKIFTQWLIGEHEQDKIKAYFRGVAVNEYRGFTAEVPLTWWGRLKKWLNKKYSMYWTLTDLNLSLNYQLLGIDMHPGKQGILISFEQFLAPEGKSKYRDPNDSQKEPLGNTKRVFITDCLVEQIKRFNLDKINFDSICKNAHPYSTPVRCMQSRWNTMHEYRLTQKFIAFKPWYIRFWDWLFPTDSLSDDIKNDSKSVSDNKLLPLYKSETIQIEQYSKTHEIIVKEIRPHINNVVYCGGGAKIFGHVGFWKALNEANIHPAKFAGSSAGAIMALLCYLGYNSEEIIELFKNFKQEHLIHFDISFNGMSDSHSLKTALDFAITYKVHQITTQYKIPYPQGKITFATIEAIRKKCSGSNLGEELIVTATNKRLGKTSYFSLERTPDFEISEAVKISASFPIVYRSTLVDGVEHNDGGILSNLPTEVFFDDQSTLLESEFGNNLKVLAVQFDNGHERKAIDHVMDRVYKENFFINWIYKLLTGVDDPAGGWAEDRMKLRKYSAQSIVVNVDNISSTSFKLDDSMRAKMILAGYEATKDYLQARYIKSEEGVYQNDELLYTKFNSLGDLLSYCCYRSNLHWFNLVCDLINTSHTPNKYYLLTQAEELRILHFPSSKSSTSTSTSTTPTAQSPTFFGNTVAQIPSSATEENNHKVLLAVYPIFLKLVPELLKDNSDKKVFDFARHSFSLHKPFACLEHFAKIKAEMNIILYIIIQLLKELKNEASQKIYDELGSILKLLNSGATIFKEEFYNRWDLSLTQSLQVLASLHQTTGTEQTTISIDEDELSQEKTPSFAYPH